MAGKGRNRQKQGTRIIAIVLAALLALGVIVGTLMGMGVFDAGAEAQANIAPDRCELDMDYLTEEQALRITQRLVYTNRSRDHLRQVVFYATGNMFRRESALMYEAKDLETVFSSGYAPAGIDLQAVRFEGAAADHGFQGENELLLRVDCDLAPGESGTFEFDYYLLLMTCGAFQGIGETDVRLSAFYFAPGMYNEQYHEFTFKQPLPFTRWLFTQAMDFDVTLTVPDTCDVAATGAERLEAVDDHSASWRIEATNVREFAVAFGRRYREETYETASGVQVRVLSNVRGAQARAGKAAVQAIELCEEWFGAYPIDQLDIVQSDYPLGVLNFPGIVWVPTAMLEAGSAEQLTDRIRFCVAQQIFGMAACVECVADAWLSDSLCEYVSCLMLEETEGRQAFLDHINRQWLSALQLTLPGGLVVSSDAALFDEAEYDIVVRRRGAVVFHELREAMGRDALLSGLAEFARMGGGGAVLTEMDLVKAMDVASGGDWEAFLTDWVFNVGDYADQTMFEYD